MASRKKVSDMTSQSYGHINKYNKTNQISLSIKTNNNQLTALEIAQANVRQLQSEVNIPKIKVSEAIKDLQVSQYCSLFEVDHHDE